MSKTIEEIKAEVATDDNFHNWESLFDSCAMYDYGRLENAIDKVAERYAQSQTQELKEWKESMMKVHSELDLQGIGNALGLPLGSSIAPQVLPRVKELIELLEHCKSVIYAYNHYSPTATGNEILQAIQERLTKYNHLKSNTNG